MKPGKIILLGIIGAVIIGLLVVITTLLPTTFISQQSLIDVVGIVMFARLTLRPMNILPKLFNIFYKKAHVKPAWGMATTMRF